MGVSVMFHGAPDGDDGPFDLASTGAWTAFVAAVDALPSAGNAALRSLADQGEAKGTHDLADELAAAVSAGKLRGAAAGVAAELAAVLGVGDPDETATIAD
jgi:hypothetical protein